MTLPADRVGDQVRILTFADRVTLREAECFFQAGGAVLVSEFGREPSQPVYRDTTFHTSLSISWEDLDHQVREWRGRYPNQRYYALRPVDPVTTGQEVASLLSHLQARLRDIARRDRDDRVDEFQSYQQDTSLAHTLSVLLASAIAVHANGISGATRSTT